MTEDKQTPATAPTLMSRTQTLATPLAIIIGFGLIAAALYFSGINSNTTSQPNKQTDANGDTATETAMNPVTDEDHIRGSKDAPIVLVEYSDYDCPFCRLFHDTMKKLYEEYDGQVAWVYRQFPIQSLHPNAPKLSESSECVARLGGNDAFWKFTDALNDSRQIEYKDDGSIQSIEPTDMNKLSDFVAAAGVNEDDFNNCLANASEREAVQDDLNNGAAMGINGTPHTVVLYDGKQGVINGAQQYDAIKQLIDSLLKQMSN